MLIKLCFCVLFNGFIKCRKIYRVWIHLSGPTSLADDSDRVVVPQVPGILNFPETSILHSLVDPLTHCEDTSKGFYMTTRQSVRE